MHATGWQWRTALTRLYTLKRFKSFISVVSLQGEMQIKQSNVQWAFHPKLFAPLAT